MPLLNNPLVAIFGIVGFFATAMISLYCTVQHQTKLTGFSRWQATEHSAGFDAEWRRCRLRFAESKLKGCAFLISQLVCAYLRWKRRTWVGRFDLRILVLCAGVIAVGLWDVVLSIIELAKGLLLHEAL